MGWHRVSDWVFILGIGAFALLCVGGMIVFVVGIIAWLSPRREKPGFNKEKRING